MQARVLAGLRALNRPFMHVLTTSIVALLVGCMLYYSVRTFSAPEYQPSPLTFITDAPAPNTVPRVTVGLYIKHFPVFDITHNNFTADIFVTFTWQDPQIDNDVIEKFSFDQGTLVTKELLSLMTTDGTTKAIYRCQVKFTSLLDHSAFPLSDHRLFLVLKNEFAAPSQFIFTASESQLVVAPHASTSVWQLVGTAAEAGFFSLPLDAADPQAVVEFPGVVFSFDLAKQGMRNIILIMFPIFVLFIISSLSLLLSPETHVSSMLGISTGTLTGLIAYRYVVGRIEPDVGYFTITDYIFDLFLGAIFCILLVNLISIKYAAQKELMQAIKGGVLTCLQVLLVISLYLLTYGT